MSKEPQFTEVLPLTTWQRLRQLLTVIAAIIAAITGSTAVSIQGCRQPPNNPPGTSPTPPPTSPEKLPPGTDPNPKPDPVAAIHQIQFGNAGCSATFIWPQLPDGRWQAVTAAHCVKGQPSQGVAVLKDGRRIRMVVQERWDGPDLAWLITELPIDSIPYAMLAQKDAEPGEKIWHVGYGFDKPKNREDGTVTTKANARGQCEYWLSVSNGDSGGGIALNASGEILSPVCCTTGIAAKARVWGCSPEMARKLRPLPTPAAEEWTPIPIPIVMPGD